MFQATVASFTSSDPSATTAEFTATVNYGDGTTSSVGTVVAAPGGFIVVDGTKSADAVEKKVWAEVQARLI